MHRRFRHYRLRLTSPETRGPRTAIIRAMPPVPGGGAGGEEVVAGRVRRARARVAVRRCGVDGALAFDEVRTPLGRPRHTLQHGSAELRVRFGHRSFPENMPKEDE